MHCPKCDQPTELLVLEIITGTSQGLICAAGDHCFLVATDKLTSDVALDEVDVLAASDLTIGDELAAAIREDRAQFPDEKGFQAFLKRQPTIDAYRTKLRTQSIVVCPKCTSEPKGTLRVLEGMRTIDTDCKELCGLICDQRHHWFYIRIEDLEGPEEITSAQISSIPSLENAEAGLAQFDNLSAEQAAACHQQGVIHYPTIAEYRARKKRLRILLVDDEAQIRTSLTRAIMDILNADVIPATNGEEAVELFQMHGPFNLVITDYNMPELNGLEAAHDMLKMVPDQKIILMSADSEVAKEIGDSKITFRYKLDRTKDFIALIQQLCK